MTNPFLSFSLIPSIIISSIFLSLSTAFAQRKLLVLNEDNKYMYYRIETLSDTSQLRANQFLSFLKGNYKDIKAGEASMEIVHGKGKLTVFKSTVIGHEEGEIDYNLTFERKNEKYRYWFTDFTFIPYERNRYDVFVPVNGIRIPVEESAKFKDGDLNRYLDQIGSFCQRFNVQLHAYLLKKTSLSLPKDTVKKVSTKNW